MAQLRVAVVGCTGIGRTHLGCWSLMTGVTVAAVCDADGHAAARMAARFEECAAFADPKILLSNGQYDIVDVCVELSERFEIARRALLFGAHVVYEAPASMESDRTAELAQTADGRERLLMPLFSHRFHGGVRFIKELLDNDDIGRPVRFRFAVPSENTADPDFATDSEEPIGALADIGVHGIDMFRWLCGEVAEAGSVGLLGRALRRKGPEDFAALVLRSTGGAIGTVEVGPGTPGQGGHLEIYATAGACSLDYESGIVRYLTADLPTWRQVDSGGPDRYESALGHFADAVRGLQKLEITGFDGQRAAEICSEIYRGSTL